MDVLACRQPDPSLSGPFYDNLLSRKRSIETLDIEEPRKRPRLEESYGSGSGTGIGPSEPLDIAAPTSGQIPVIELDDESDDEVELVSYQKKVIVIDDDEDDEVVFCGSVQKERTFKELPLFVDLDEGPQPTAPGNSDTQEGVQPPAEASCKTPSEALHIDSSDTGKEFTESAGQDIVELTDPPALTDSLSTIASSSPTFAPVSLATSQLPEITDTSSAEPLGETDVLTSLARSSIPFPALEPASAKPKKPIIKDEILASLQETFGDDLGDDLDVIACLAKARTKYPAAFDSPVEVKPDPDEKKPDKRSAIVRKKAFFMHTSPDMHRAMMDAVWRLWDVLGWKQDPHDCWFHPKPPKSTATITISITAKDLHGQSQSVTVNEGVLPLFLNGKLTPQMIKGLCEDSWHLSHLCGNWICCNPAHHTIESTTINQHRKRCHNETMKGGCPHKPPCLPRFTRPMPMVRRTWKKKPAKNSPVDSQEVVVGLADEADVEDDAEIEVEKDDAELNADKED